MSTEIDSFDRVIVTTTLESTESVTADTLVFSVSLPSLGFSRPVLESYPAYIGKPHELLRRE